ncbi:MAG: LysM peptidoglycan-binding domain-containing protein [Planktomarina sp.]
MEQTENRKKIVMIALLFALSIGGIWLWQQTKGAMFSPMPTVVDAPVAALNTPDTGQKPTLDVTAGDPVVTIPSTSVPTPDIPQTIALETAPATQPDAGISDQVANISSSESPMDPITKTDTVTPQFDVVRVEDDGTALIAGTTPWAGDLSVLLDGAVVDGTTTPVGANQQFVVFTSIPPATRLQVLELAVTGQDGQTIVSAQNVFLSPRLGEIVPDANIAAVELPDVPSLNTDPAEPIAADAPLQAPTVLLADEDGSLKVIASPVATIALDTIQYDLEGEIALGGRAAGAGFVRVYLDNQAITTSRIKEDGFWSTDLPDVDTGVYTLRVDELDAAGEVTSRVETPFKREDPEVFEALLGPNAWRDLKEATVQPGLTLWEMSVAKYGDGTQFFKVFEANKDRIRDPNMIFPGQIFDLPD